MSRHATKQNGVSVLIHKKPYDCLYEKKSIRAKPSEQYNEQVIAEYNERITEVLREIPNHENWLLIRKIFIECGLRKESSGTAIPKDSVIKNKISSSM